MTPLVNIQNVHNSFTRGNERIDVLQGVNLRAADVAPDIVLRSE